MDRLPHLTILPLLAVGLLGSACDREPGPAATPVGRRVDAVPAAPKAPVDLDDFCEVRLPAESAPTLTWPELAEGTPPTGATGWTWVNVWATWCAPCIEEMPRILTWPQRLAQKGAAIDIVLLSVDDSAAKVSAFRKGHDWMPESLRSAQPDVVTPWLAELGIELPSLLPLHLFVDPQGRVRCARSGSLSADAADAIEVLAAGG